MLLSILSSFVYTGERTRTSTVSHSILSRARLPFRHAGVFNYGGATQI